jgi:hypothetical protein
MTASISASILIVINSTSLTITVKLLFKSNLYYLNIFTGNQLTNHSSWSEIPACFNTFTTNRYLSPLHFRPITMQMYMLKLTNEILVFLFIILSWMISSIFEVGTFLLHMFYKQGNVRFLHNHFPRLHLWLLDWMNVESLSWI